MSAAAVDALYQRAMAAQAAADRGAAMDCFERILAVAPDHLDANYLLGTLRAESGDLKGGLALLQRAAELAPDSPYIQNNLGTLQRLLGNVPEAVKAFRRACALAPDFVDARGNLGAVLAPAGDAEEAIGLLDAVVRERPDWDVAQFNLGLALRRTRDWPRAIVCLERAAALRPGNAKYLETLAMTCFHAGQAAAAKRHAKAWLARFPSVESEVPLLLSRIDKSAVPARYPVACMVETYRGKAGSWERDIRQADNAFFGPQLVAAALAKLDFERPTRVLDIGCGTGICAEFLRPHATRLVGVDLSPDMLERARGRYDELQCRDILDYLGAADSGEFGLMVASGVLILFGDLGPVLRQAAARLRPGGCLVFTLYRSREREIQVRHNLHFAHSRRHVERRCGEAGLELLAIEPAVHELEAGQAQEGWIVSLRRAPA